MSDTKPTLTGATRLAHTDPTVLSNVGTDTSETTIRALLQQQADDDLWYRHF